MGCYSIKWNLVHYNAANLEPVMVSINRWRLVKNCIDRSSVCSCYYRRFGTNDANIVKNREEQAESRRIKMNKGLYYPKCYALVSGGKDSLSAAQILHESGKLSACVALETGISTPDWKDFVIKD